MHEELFDWKEIAETGKMRICEKPEEDEFENMKRNLIENIKSDVDRFMGKLRGSCRDTKKVSEEECRNLLKHAS